MPVGNIAPRTDTLTLTSMKLGSEEYPSTVQQAEGANTGYLLYRPIRCHESIGGTACTSSAGTTSTQIGAIYLVAGDYDIEITFNAASDNTGAAWLQIGAVYASSVHTVTAGTTIVESLAGVTLTAGWHSLYAVVYDGAGATEMYNTASALKQYA